MKYWRDALKKMTETAAWKKELENHQWVASFEDETFTDSLAKETKMYTDLLTSLNLVKKTDDRSKDGSASMAKLITLLLPVFSLVYLWQSYLLPSGNVLIGARTFPLMVGGIMLVVSLILVWQQFRPSPPAARRRRWMMRLTSTWRMRSRIGRRPSSSSAPCSPSS